MAEQVLLPKQGNTVESCIIVTLHKRLGDAVSEGETLCEVETDKSTMEVPAPRSGTVLAWLVAEGDDVPVLSPIAVLGEAGEQVPPEVSAATTAHAAPATPAATTAHAAPVASAAPESPVPTAATAPTATASSAATQHRGAHAVSPRARMRAAELQIELAALGGGSGPGGRIIERDVVEAAERLTEDRISYAPTSTTRETAGTADTAAPLAAAAGDEVPRIPTTQPRVGAASEPVRRPLSSVRKVIAQRMRESLQSTAQLTLNAYADARALRGLRERFKREGAPLGLENVSLNDMLLYAVAQTLVEFPALNAHFTGDAIIEHAEVNLGFAVDTPRGLLVPTIASAQRLSLRALSAAAKALSTKAVEGKSAPAELAGGTFTVTNLGAFGIETFTPVLNPPQVAILGVGAIALKAVEREAGVEHIPHVALSLTIDHQAVDGAPGARFLRTLAQRIGAFDLLIAR